MALSASDVDGTVASFQITGLPAHGTLYRDAGLTQAIALNGTTTAATVYFKPDANWSGATAFQYAAIDNNGLTDATPATASITVAPVADTPAVSITGAGTAFTSAGDVSITNPFFTTVGDFNGDGKLDLAVSNFPPAPGGNTISVMLGDGTGHFGAPIVTGAGSAPNASFAADFNGDGKLDLAVANQDSADVSILLGNGNGTFQAQASLSAQNPTSVVAADFNEDGKIDLAVGMSVGNAAKIFLGNGNGTFQNPTSVASGHPIGQIAVGDLNGDGNLDLVASVHGGAPSALVMLGDGHGNFGAPTSFSLDSTGTAVSLALADLNGDGKLDLVAANTSASGIAVLLGDGAGGFGPVAHYGTVLPPNNTHTFVIEDINGDGRLDVAVANPAGDGVSILLGNGDGTLQSELLFATGDQPVQVASGDFDGDGRVDLAVSNYGEGQANTVSVLLGGTKITGTADAPIPLSLSVATADTDGSETVTVQIDGVPSAYVLNHGVLTGDGSWMVAAGDLAGLALQPASDSTGVFGTFDLTITAISADGSSTAVRHTTLSVDIPAPVNALSGLVQDGYVAGATVFSDTNNNGVLDTGEVSATTAADGSFTLVGADPDKPLVMVGGIDIATGLPFQGVMKAPGGSTVVTPLTTLVTAIAYDPDPQAPPPTAAELAAAQDSVKSALGLAATVDLTTFDAVKAIATGDAQTAAQAAGVLAAAVQVQATVTQITAAAGPNVDVVGALAATIATASAPVNLSDAGTVASVATASGADSTVVNAVSSVVAAANTTIAAGATAGDATQILTSLSQAATVALGTTTQALATTDFNNAGAVTALQTNYTGTNLTDQVAAAPVAVISLPIIGTIGGDTLTGTAGADAIDGLDGNDVINGADGNDQLYGGAGNDALTGGAGNDTIDGGTGQDLAVYSDATTSGITVNLAAGTVAGDASIGNDTLVSVEQIRGTDFDDTFTAGNFSATSTNAGNPNNAGNVINVFEGGGGNDTINGNGRTVANYFHATGAVTVQLSSGAAAGSATGNSSVGSDVLNNVTNVRASEFADTLTGGTGNDAFTGGAGNDQINGGAGFDLAVYTPTAGVTASGGINVAMAAGTVTGDASIGTDTLRRIESVRGTNFDDTYNAVGYTGSGAATPSANASDNGQNAAGAGFNEFEGMGGNDTITGNGNTRIRYDNAGGAVTVDIAAGSATGDSSIGTDTFTGVTQVRGTSFNDTILGSNTTSATEVFDGWAGNDLIDGKGGFDQVTYNNNANALAGVTINMTAGTVVGDAAYGSDTLRSIEQIVGTNLGDTYNAVNFGAAGFLDTSTNNVGNNGTFNSFNGMGGNDDITGNGNTQILYSNATGAVTVNLATGTATKTGTLSGTDTFHGGINNVVGSSSADSLTGGNSSVTFTGGGGSDTITGGSAADMAIFSGSAGQYTISSTLVHDTVSGRDGDDTLSSIEVLGFNINAAPSYLLIASGSSGSPIDVTGLSFNGNGALTRPGSTSTNDFLKIGQNLSNHLIDLGAGTDTVTLGVTGGYTLNLANVENLAGTAGNDTVTLTTIATSLSVDLGDGNDTLNLANGANSLSVQNVESIFTTDFSGSSNDTLTLQNNVSGVNVNLANGDNTLNLAAGSNSLGNVFGVQHIIGTTQDDTLSITTGLFSNDNNPIVDLGTGNNTLNLGVQNAMLSVVNVGHLNGNGANNYFTLNSMVSGIIVDLDAGADTLQVANGSNSLSLLNVENINASDFAGSSNDTLTLQNNVSGLNVNLGGGTNALNLASGGSSSLNNLFGVQSINGSGNQDTLTLTSGAAGIVIDLAGGNDTLNLASGSFVVTAVNVETVAGSAGSDSITLVNASGATVTGGLGADFITASSGADTFRYTSVADSPSGPGRDTVTNFNAAQDTFRFDGAGIATQIHFVSSGVLDGTPAAPQVEAILANIGGLTVLQVDVDGDGQIGAGDMEIALSGLTGNLSDANFQVTGTVNQAPTNIFLSNASVPENSANGTVVGTLSDADADSGDTATFTLFDDAGGRFTISGTNLIVAAPLDYESAPTQQVTVRVTDSVGHTFDKTFTIVVTDVNEAPTAVSLTNTVTSTPENGGVVKVADIVVSDDALGTNTLSLSGADAAAFTIVNGELRFNGGANFEAKPSYSVTVTVDDSTVGGTPDASQSFTLSITDLNEAPTAVSFANTVSSTPENGGVVKVADIVVSDDALGTNTLSLSGADAAAFAIVNGELRFNGNANYEVKPSYSVTVNVDDSTIGGTPDASQSFTLSITDVNEAPTAVSLTNTVTSTPENGGVVKVADIVVSDDALGTNTLSLSGADAAAFAIVNGELRFSGGANYEVKPSYSVTVNVDDSAVGGTPDASQSFTLAITNLNEAPTNILLSNATVNASSANGTVVGALSTVDPDAGDTAVFTLSDNDGGLFAVSGSNLIVANSLANVTSATQSVTVHAVDGGGLPTDKTFTLTVTGITAGGTFTGTSGNDVLTGTGGNDIFDGAGGSDTLNGLAGQDAALFNDLAAGVTINVNLAGGTVTASNGAVTTLNSIEQIIGTPGNDTFTAGTFTATSTNAGTPNAAGSVINWFEGGGGSDTINGNGRTVANYFHAGAAVTVQLSSGATAGSATGSTIGTDTLNNVTTVRGSESADTLTGGTGNDAFIGGDGNDQINGGAGFDVAIYTPTAGVTATGGINVVMSTGIVTGDSTIDTDTLRRIESVRGTNFDDTYSALGYTGSGAATPSANASDNGQNAAGAGFNEFEGMGGNDTITGNGNTRIRYDNATGAVTVDIAAGTASGDASIGSDTFTGVTQVRGSSQNDTILGSNTTSATEVFDGWAGNDLIDGKGGFDQVTYNNNANALAGVVINMTAGTVVGDAAYGSDTLRSIEQIVGTNLGDTYNAVNFGAAGFLDTSTNNVGNNGTFNSFNGMGGNDDITGNGNTQIIYSNATSSNGTTGVTVDLAAGTGTKTGTLSGTDTFHGGINNVVGSSFNDTFIGGNTSITFNGGGGNDTITGGSAADMALFSGSSGQYTTISATSVIDGTSNRDGTDTLSGIEVLSFTNTYLLMAAGTAANPIDVTGLNFNGTTPLARPSGAGTTNDFLKIGQNLSNHQIDLGAGTDTVTLGVTGGYSLNLANVENLAGTSGDDFVTVTSNATGMSINLGDGNDVLNLSAITFGLSIDLGTGNDNLNLANGANSISIQNVENIFSSDFAGSSDDTLTLQNNVSGVSINLANGNNTLNLFGGSNSLASVFNVQHIIGSTGADTLSITAGLGASNNNPIIDLAGGDDTLNLSMPNAVLTALGVEHFTGNGSQNSITFNNNLTDVTFDLGDGNDTIFLLTGTNSLSATNVETINSTDFGTSSDDTLTLQNNVTGLTVNLNNGANTLNLAAGNNSFVDINNVHQVNGSIDNDALSVSGAIFNSDNNPIVDLGDGDDSLSFGAQYLNLTALNIEHINGNSFDNGMTFNNEINGLNINLASGTDFITLATGTNSLSIESVESISSSDFNPANPSDDTLELLNEVSGLTVNLQFGTNTLNLAAGSNVLAGLFGVQHVNGSASNDFLMVQTNLGAETTVDMGDGDDVLNVSGGASGVTVANTETIHGSDGNDSVVIANASTGLTSINGGLGADNITASAGHDSITFHSVADSPMSGMDTITNFDADNDTFIFDGIGIAATMMVHFVGNGPLDGPFDGHPHASANLVNSGGLTILQVDLDGDGAMTGNDIAVHLVGLTGSLHDTNFLIF